MREARRHPFRKVRVPAIKVPNDVWAESELKAEIAYRGLPGSGELRAASFEGLLGKLEREMQQRAYVAYWTFTPADEAAVLAQEQREIAADWRAAFLNYLGLC